MKRAEIEALYTAAINRISTSPNTRAAYMVDARRWLDFCEDHKVDATPLQLGARGKTKRSALVESVVAWVDEMREAGVASKTRVRRLSALSSIHEELRRFDEDVYNPFSPRSGPRRERGTRERPTPVALPAVVRSMLEACAGDAREIGRRDEALLRVLWATGMRRSSIASMTRDRLEEEGDNYIAEVVVKGKRTSRVLISGKAAAALRAYLATHDDATVFRTVRDTPMDGRAVFRVVRSRAVEIGYKKRISPHSFRAAFLTFNKAELDERQDAAAHADPNTTRGYDRTAWRGRAAFEKMPEVEDTEWKGKTER